MAAEFMAAAMEKSPEDVRGVELLVLIRLADNVMSEDGFGIMSVVKTAEVIHESEERVNQAITYLANKEIIEVVSDLRPNSPWKYPYVNFRFSPSENWA